MINCSDFIFIHNPRTGGAYVKTLFKDYIPLSCFSPLKDYHLPISKVPMESRDKLTFGLVRNPWSWYVSLYYFQQPNGKWLSLTKAKSFPDFIRTFLSDEFIQENQDKKFYPVGNPYLPPTIPKFRYMKDLRVGFFSYRYIYMFFNDYQQIFASRDFESFRENHSELRSVDRVLRLEDVPQNIIKLLADNQAPVPAKLVPKWKKAPKKNHTNHRQYQQLYTDPLIELVAKKDSIIIEKYGYKF